MSLSNLLGGAGGFGTLSARQEFGNIPLMCWFSAMAVFLEIAQHCHFEVSKGNHPLSFAVGIGCLYLTGLFLGVPVWQHTQTRYLSLPCLAISLGKIWIAKSVRSFSPPPAGRAAFQQSSMYTQMYAFSNNSDPWEMRLSPSSKRSPATFCYVETGKVYHYRRQAWVLH